MVGYIILLAIKCLACRTQFLRSSDPATYYATMEEEEGLERAGLGLQPLSEFTQEKA